MAMWVCPRILAFGGHVAVAMYVCPRIVLFGGQMAVTMCVCPRILAFGGQMWGGGGNAADEYASQMLKVSYTSSTQGATSLSLCG